MANWTGKRGKVVFSKPEDPSFLKKFKEKVGYKDQESKIAAKFEEMPKAMREDLEDGSNELPQVVQLQPGDLSQEEFEAEMCKRGPGESRIGPQEEEGEVPPAEGKILFRPPDKKRARDGFERTTSTKRSKGIDPSEEGAKPVPPPGRLRPAPNKALLSFDDDDEEDDETSLT